MTSRPGAPIPATEQLTEPAPPQRVDTADMRPIMATAQFGSDRAQRLYTSLLKRAVLSQDGRCMMPGCMRTPRFLYPTQSGDAYCCDTWVASGSRTHNPVACDFPEPAAAPSPRLPTKTPPQRLAPHGRPPPAAALALPPIPVTSSSCATISVTEKAASLSTRCANRHLTEDEQGISAAFLEVKGDGAMPATAPASEYVHHRDEPELNADDATRLGIGLTTPTTLTDFQRRSTLEHMLAMDARYDNPFSELDREAERAQEKMSAGLKGLSGEAPLTTLARHGYQDPTENSMWDDHEHGKTGTNGADNQTYEPVTAPRSTDRPRPEHMVNAAVSVDRGVVIRTGRETGSLFSDNDSTCKLEHVSAIKKAPPPAQDREHPMATGQPGPTNHGNAATSGWAASVVVALSDVLPGCVTSADTKNELWTEGNPSVAMLGTPVKVPTVRSDPRPRDAAQPSLLPNRHPT